MVSNPALPLDNARPPGPASPPSRAGAHPAADAVLLAVSAVLGLFITLHVWVLDMGEWQKDEFRFIAGLRDAGPWFVVHRFVSISPRPVSELILTAYAALVLLTRHPLMREILLAGWIGLLGCCLLPLCCASKQRPLRLLLGLALFCLFLLGHPVADLFYWPMAMAAYVPTLCGLAAFTWLLLDRRSSDRPGRRLALVALLFAAGSSELGAIAVVPVALAQLALPLAKDRRRAWLAAALAVAVAILLAGLIGRGVRPTPLITPTAHHFLPSLMAAAPEALRQILLIDLDDGNWGQAGLGWVALGVPVKLGIFASFALLLPVAFPRRDRSALLAVALALPAAIYLSIASAYFEFGFLCCQRHETARQCLVVLVLVAAAGALPDRAAWRWQSTAARVMAGLVCLTIAMAPMIAVRLPNIADAYRQERASREHLARLWATGFSPGRPPVMQQSKAILVHAWTFPPGDHKGAPPLSDCFEAMAFFRKPELIVLPP